MESIIDLAAILQHPAWMKKTPGHNGTPHLTSSIWEIASLNQLNEKREKGAKEGKKGDTLKGFSERKKNFFSCSAFPVLFLSGQQHNEQTEEKKNCKELFVYCIFSSPLAAVLCLKMEGFECVSMSLCAGCVRACVRWLVQYSIFSFSHIKGAINFLLLLLPECNTQARIAERLGHDLANMQDELIYQTPQTKACQKMRDKTEDRGGRGWGEGGTGFIRRNTVWDEETEG